MIIASVKGSLTKSDAENSHKTYLSKVKKRKWIASNAVNANGEPQRDTMKEKSSKEKHISRYRGYNIW